jgi:threonine aldolase
MSNMIDLRSDTVTLPDKSMRKIISRAEVGDDAYGEDKSVNILQDYCKELFQVEDALFVTSGMLSNRLAIMSQVEKGDEVITEYNYHINFFDSAAFASICNVVLNTIRTKNGILTCNEVKKVINSKPRYYYFSQPKLVSIENTINGWVGKIVPIHEIKKLRLFTKESNMSIHLDGARIFNAHVETNVPLAEYARQVDTMSICLSKGLGSPYGSVLMGKKEIIDKARRYKVWLGGGVHQVGFNAKAAYYAIKNNIDKIKIDHENTQVLLDKLKKIEELIINPLSGSTNMIQFDVSNLKLSSNEFLERCKKSGLLLFPWLPNIIRAVVHKDISSSDITLAVEIIKKVVASVKRKNG